MSKYYWLFKKVSDLKNWFKLNKYENVILEYLADRYIQMLCEVIFAPKSFKKLFMYVVSNETIYVLDNFYYLYFMHEFIC